MENVKQSYTDFHKKNRSRHLYPTEWIVRTMLGNYPGLKFDRSGYVGGKILDLGFGDGRNFPLLHNCGLEIHGVEITEETLTLAHEALQMLQIPAELKVGSNTSIPYPDGFFDYVLASSACYYIDSGFTFSDNLKEITRVLKPGGYLIANFPAYPKHFIYKNATIDLDGHITIIDDLYGIRNGYKFRAFRSPDDIKDTFSPLYTDISIGDCVDNYYGVQHHIYIATFKKL